MPKDERTSCDDLESPWIAAVDEPLDLVASLVHVSIEGKLPQTTSTTINATTATTTTLVPSEFASSPTHQQLPFLTPHQYVTPQTHDQRHIQVSLLKSSPTPKLAIVSSLFNAHASPTSPDNARLTEPFSPVYPIYDSNSNSEENWPVNPDQLRYRAATVTTTVQSIPTLQPSLNLSPLSPKYIEAESIAVAPPMQKSKMFFGDLQKGSTTAYRRKSMAMTSAVTEYEADLTSRDRIKQKDAIKRVLAGKIRDDWSWDWPREGDEPHTPVVNRNNESHIEEDWKEREEWTSNASGSDDENSADVDTPTMVDNANSNDPFRFDSPDGVADTVRKTAEERKARHRRRLEEEMRTNDGLSCFTHRRNAWTGARLVRRVPRASSNIIPLKRTLSRSTSTPSPTAPTISYLAHDEDSLDMITEVRIAPPILPPETPMRKAINERTYSTIYDKVVLQSQTPFCPINLSVVTKSCVEGWKRDGEWPPVPGEMDAVIASVKRAGLVPEGGSGKDRRNGVGSGGKSKSVLRRSLQKVMVAVRERAGSKGKEGEVALRE